MTRQQDPPCVWKSVVLYKNDAADSKRGGGTEGVSLAGIIVDVA